MNENKIEAEAFATWYVANKPYLKRIIRKTYTFDADILSDIFLSIYARIMNGARIKYSIAYILGAYRYKSIDKHRTSKRLVLVEDHNPIINIYSYEN